MATIDLLYWSATQGFEISGAAEGDMTGSVVKNVGDINGDGLNDIAIGIPEASPGNRKYAGLVVIIFGAKEGLGNIDLKNFTEDQGFEIWGAVTYDATGSSVSGAGDIDGDGIDDLVIGAYVASPEGRTQAGCVYIIRGKVGKRSYIDLARFTALEGIKIFGAAAGDWTGSSVSGGGDVNGDGVSDIIIGAYRASPINRSFAGIVFVILSNATGLDNIIDLANVTAPQVVRFFGAAAKDGAGFSVSNIGDINSDGISDMAIGVPFASPNNISFAGLVAVIWGNTTGFADIDLAEIAPHQGFQILGATSDDVTGRSVNGAGDINGDGIADLVIGASAENTDRAGTVYAILGNTTGLHDIDLANLTTKRVLKIFGGGAGYKTGISVSAAGDVNGDGIGDLLIGASGASPHRRDSAGIAYVVLGNTNILDNDIHLAHSTAERVWRIEGATSDDSVGSAVSNIGDINGDGIDDYLVGAEVASPNNKAMAGSVYGIYGIKNHMSVPTSVPTPLLVACIAAGVTVTVLCWMVLHKKAISYCIEENTGNVPEVEITRTSFKAASGHPYHKLAGEDVQDNPLE